jgi:hypothetical protein
MGDLRGQFMALHAVPLTNGAVFKHTFETPFQLQISRNFGFGTVLVGATACASPPCAFKSHHVGWGGRPPTT